MKWLKDSYRAYMKNQGEEIPIDSEIDEVHGILNRFGVKQDQTNIWDLSSKQLEKKTKEKNEAQAFGEEIEKPGEWKQLQAVNFYKRHLDEEWSPDKEDPTTEETKFIKEAEDEWDKFNRIKDENAGRYLPGFRHYESYNHYVTRYPDASIDDYHHDMNREASYDEFLELFRQYVRYQMELDPFFQDDINQLTNRQPHIVEAFLSSSDFEKLLIQDFERRQ